MNAQPNDRYDVAVIGGGAAGLNGALMLVRSRRRVLVIDAGQPRNAPAEGVHGLLGRDGMAPAELLALGRDEVRRYGGEVLDAEVVAAERDGTDFLVTLAGGRTLRARRLLVTTGVIDVLPEVTGLADRWGRDIVHCPYCHGWEVRDRAIGVLASSERALHQALLFRQLSGDVIMFADGVTFSADQREELAAAGIGLVEGAVSGLEISDDRLSGVRLTDGTVVERTVLAVQTGMTARADLLAGVGLRAVEHPMGIGSYVPADTAGRTDVPGIWVAGNVADPMAQVGASAAAGAMAGAVINADLVTEDLRTAVADRRAQELAEVSS